MVISRDSAPTASNKKTFGEARKIGRATNRRFGAQVITAVWQRASA